jgi:hypothetical protein
MLFLLNIIIIIIIINARKFYDFLQAVNISITF